MTRQLLILALLMGLTLGCRNENGASEARETREQLAEGDAGTMPDGGMMGEEGRMGRDGMMDMMRDMPEWMMSGNMGMDDNMMRDMGVIHDLLMNHESIRREVEDIPGGVRTVTTSSDPDVERLIRSHVRQMKERVEEGRAIRQMDPVFREIFDNHTKIDLQIEDIPGGVRVVETSDDPQVTLLIRQHAHRAVSEFVQDGMRRAMRPTPLPQAYRR